jgi:hypothetical protein
MVGAITHRTSEYPITVVTRRGRGWRNVHAFGGRAQGEWFQVAA